MMKNYSDKSKKVFFAYFAFVVFLVVSPLWTRCNAQKPTYNEVPNQASLFAENPDALNAYMKALKEARNNGETLNYEEWAYAYFNIDKETKKSLLKNYPTSHTGAASKSFIVDSSFLTASTIGLLINDVTFENLDAYSEQRYKTYKTAKYACYGTAILGGILMISGGVHLRRASLLVNEGGVGIGINLAMKQP